MRRKRGRNACLGGLGLSVDCLVIVFYHVHRKIYIRNKAKANNKMKRMEGVEERQMLKSRLK